VTLGRSGASCAGAISRRAPTKNRERERAVWVPKRSKAPRSFGNRRPSRGGGGRGPRPCPRREGESPAPPKQRCGDPGARGNVRGGTLTRQTVSPSLVRPRPVLVLEAKVSGARAARFHRGTDLRKQKSSVSNVGSAPLREQRRKRGRGFSEFTGEDRLLEGCARASCRVAEVGRRRLAQRSVSRVLF